QARFTVNETLPVLQARFPGYRLVLMFGDDVIAHIAHWPHVAELVESVDLLIATRKHHELALHQVIETLAVTRNLRINYELVILDHKATSSSSVRQAIKKGLPTDTSAQVCDYAHEHGLYASRI
ncbi:MAG: hypothetical protein ABI354_03585, partial [Candidatus Saccharimonadales bacterium]